MQTEVAPKGDQKPGEVIIPATRDILDVSIFFHSRNEEKIDDPTDAEHPEGAEPQKPGPFFAVVKPVCTGEPKEPEKVARQQCVTRWWKDFFIHATTLQRSSLFGKGIGMWQPNEDLRRSALGLIEGEKNLIANLANLAAVIYHSLPDLNWAGFYLWDNKRQELVLGPFQGKPACLRIKSGRGVCGTAYAQMKTQRVDDVHAFPGHIACDSASRSELVIPLVWEGQCIGVLDLDSPKLARFTKEEAQMLETLMRECMQKIWPERELL